MRMVQFYFLLTILCGLGGCVLSQQNVELIPDERVGPNLVIYAANDRNTRRAAQAIAQKTG
ncbi:MAG: hypothetical protein LBK73_00410, partial [Treponema sp.]|nr:hypothetical protein [Treponema sp.]